MPDEVAGWIGETRYAETADFPVERGYIWTSCASVENGNPLYWDDKVAAEITGGPIAPPSTLSLWFRPHHWQPGQTTQKLPLQVHFDLKERLGLPEAIMSDSEVVFHEPVRPGDVVSTSQVLRSLSEPEDDQARHRALLGHRRAVPQPGRRAGRRRDVHRLRLRARRVAEPVTRRRPRSVASRRIASDDVGGGRGAARRGVRRRRPAHAHLRRHGHDRRARGARHPRLAADAPRPGLRHRAQRRPRHLPQHAQPAGLVRAVRDRLDRPARPARPPALPHAGLGVPRRDDGAHRHRHRHRDRRPPAAAGRR